MNIIFDNNIAQQLKNKYMVLELDTIMQPGLKEPVVLHAIIESVDLAKLPLMAVDKETHETLIAAYKSGDWDLATHLANTLMGKWDGEIDQFYQIVIDYSAESAKLNRQWDGIRHTVPKHETFE